MYISVTLFAAIAAVVEAYAVPAGHAFQDPKTIKGAVRSPCPVCSLKQLYNTFTYTFLQGLNALANHGFINRNGKDLTIPGLIAGLAAGMNVGADFTTAIGAAGLLSAPNPLLGSFDLNDLRQHNCPIEVSTESSFIQCPDLLT